MFRFSMDIKDALKHSEKELLSAGIFQDSDFTQQLWKELQDKYPQYQFYPGVDIENNEAKSAYLMLEDECHFRCNITPGSYEEASDIVSSIFFFQPERVWLEDSLIPSSRPTYENYNTDSAAPVKRNVRPGYCKCGSGKKYKKCCGK